MIVQVSYQLSLPFGKLLNFISGGLDHALLLLEFEGRMDQYF